MAPFANSMVDPMPRRILSAGFPEEHAVTFASAQRGGRGAFEVQHTATLQETLFALSAEPFDALVVTLELPDSHGLATLDAVAVQYPGLPIIVVGSADDEGQALETLRRGAQDYLPEDNAGPTVLLRAVRYAIERKRREADRLKSHRMQAAASLTDSIPHEFNNLLQVITGYTQYALEGLEPESQQCQDLQQVMQAAERAAALTEQLLEESRSHVLLKRQLDLGHEVRQLARMLRPLLGHSIRFEAQLAEDARVAWGDANLLQQALMNLCINARDAMPQGGLLRITSRREPAALDSGLAAAQNGGCVVLEVADTGCGMSLEVQQRIFEPFFTTKTPDQGTGLGLAVVQGIVQQHGGRVMVESEPGAGTRIAIAIPSSPAAEFPLAPPTSNPPIPDLPVEIAAAATRGCP